MLRFLRSKVSKPAGLLIGLSVLFGSSCTEDNPTQPQTFSPELSALVLPAIVYTLSPRKHTISVKVEDPQGLADLDEVVYTIGKSGAATPIITDRLADDGKNGDILPNDGVFSGQIDGSFAQNDSGDFSLQVVARDQAGNQSDMLEANFLVRPGNENFSPEIVNVTVPATVPFDSTFSFLISARVIDADGLADIESVTYQFFPPAHPVPTVENSLTDNGEGADLVAGDGVFSASLSSGLVETANDYFLRFQSVDRSGNKSNPTVAVIRGRAKIDAAPVITNIQAPDIVNINTTAEVVVRVDVSDPNGLSDIDTVTFRVILADGQETPDSPRHMFDDGNPANSGDPVAGDGTYSAILLLSNNGSEAIDLRLSFQAKDRSGSLSKTVEHILTVALDDAPVISNLVAPGQVQINPTQDTRIQITLDVKDPQSLADIDTVQFRSFLPSGQEGMASPFQLFDDGQVDLNGDEVAGDGRFSLIIVLPSQGVPLGDFRFVFTARDQSGLMSNVIEHIMTVSN